MTITALQESRLKALEGLYREWNAQINVISRKDIDNVYEHHVLHSLAIAKYLETVPGLEEAFTRRPALPSAIPSTRKPLWPRPLRKPWTSRT